MYALLAAAPSHIYSSRLSQLGISVTAVGAMLWTCGEMRHQSFIHTAEPWDLAFCDGTGLLRQRALGLLLM